MTEHFIDSDGIRIHAIELNEDSGSMPLVVIPGMVNSAEEVVDAIGAKLVGRTVVLSIRGRGRSDSPPTRYSLEDQTDDVLAVVRHFNFNAVVLFGHSVGATFAINSSQSLQGKLKGLILGDFPPFYPPFDPVWSQRVKMSETTSISATALDSIVAEAQYVDVSDRLISYGGPILLLKGGNEDSALRDEDVDRLKALVPDLHCTVIESAGHEFIQEQPGTTAGIIEEFIHAIPQTSTN